MPCLAHALCDGLHVKGLQADQIHHLRSSIFSYPSVVLCFAEPCSLLSLAAVTPMHQEAGCQQVLSRAYDGPDC